MPEREVTVHRFEELLARGRPRRPSAIECSAGTYVRSLIADLGDAYCEELRRTRVGPFDVADADPARVLGLGDALALPARRARCEGDAARRAGHGQAVEGEPPAATRARSSCSSTTTARSPIAEPRAGRPAEAHRRLPRVKVTPPAPTRSRGRAASPSARSTASTSATARSSAAPTPC